MKGQDQVGKEPLCVLQCDEEYWEEFWDCEPTLATCFFMTICMPYFHSVHVFMPK